MFRRPTIHVLHEFRRNASTTTTSHNKRKIERVLIANRGEIALRVMRTARKLGIESVAVFSDADVNAQHTKFADQAFRIGEPSPLKSYLCSDRIIDVALKSGAQAIHPGYGFLSENAEFAEKCAEAGITFIGPPPNAIRKMGMKNEAKKIMIAANVPVIEGYNDANQDADYLFEQAKKIEFPVMIKAVYGGGGKGMRIARTANDFHGALESAKSESSKAFGNSEMIIEKFVERPRHVEVQVFGDTHQNYVYLWERDCSIQRRHQKIIEEAPAPGLSMDTRREIGNAGANAARAVGYVGAGTVEFIMDPLTQKFYFMEMNTRLQVEHPITEAITGVDLVEWQFKVAEGAEIPLKQEEIPLNGHAMEARVYAEDSNFMPTAGRLEYLSFPRSRARIDSGVIQGDEVTVFYDPMIAKVIVHGANRTEAISKLNAALSDTHIGGLPNNVSFVQRCLNHAEFVAERISTDFIEENKTQLLDANTKTASNEVNLVEGVCARLLLQAYSQNSTAPNGPFGSAAFFRLNHDAQIKMELSEGTKVDVIVHRNGSKIDGIQIGDKLCVKLSNIAYSLTENTKLPHVRFVVEDGGRQWSVKAVQLENTLAVFGKENYEWPIAREAPDYDAVAGGNTELQSCAPMPGIVEKIFVNVGDVVNAGQTLCTMIAMKMEYVLKAPFKCKVESISCQPGKNVQKNAVLIKYERIEE